MEIVLYSSFFVGILALIFACIKAITIKAASAGNKKMIEIAQDIRDGSIAFLKREYKLLLLFIIIITILLVIFNFNDPILMLQGSAFAFGAICSGTAGFFGMMIATLTNVRTTNAACKSLGNALKIAFDGGTVVGMSVVGIGVLGLSFLFLLYSKIIGLHSSNNVDKILTIVSGFSMGASLIALFARVGGGIYTKAADIGADLVGKLEQGIPEDDRRNPAVIADNVGDNVGDVAGMGADLFESYIGAIISSMIIGSSMSISIIIDGKIVSEYTLLFIYFPLVIAAIGVVASILGTFCVKINKEQNLQFALNLGSYLSTIMMLLGSVIAIYLLIPQSFNILNNNIIYNKWGLLGSISSGLIAGIGVGLITEYYCSKGRTPVLGIVKAASTGSATTIISGISVGMRSTAIPILLIVITTIISNYLAGLYGIAIAALGMLSTTGIQLSVDAYGPIADNAGGIAEMSGLSSQVRHRTDKLDAIGNTTAAIGKGFAICSAALTAFALFSAYQTKISSSLNYNNNFVIDITRPHVMAGVLLGAMLPFLFSAMAMDAVGKAAFSMIKEVRRQFKEIKGLLDGSVKADYARCVDISAVSALKEMFIPGLLAVLFPILIGFIDASGLMLGGLLVGVISSGVLMAIFMSNSGGAWDNAKKQIEEEDFNNNISKNSERYNAAVTADTVGDPFKDTAGPSLNILIKLVTIIALLIVPIITKYGLHIFDK